LTTSENEIYLNSTRMDEIDMMEQRAVDAAINQQWKEAITLNEKILAKDSKNLAACLRLGFAHLQAKNNKEAKRYYQKAIRIQPKNQVAIENLERLKILGERSGKKGSGVIGSLNPNLFLEIPGKTKSVMLVNPGQKKDLAELVAGQEVELKFKTRKVEARTKSGKYVGCLPDDLSKRLLYFIEAKSKYAAHVKEAGINRVVLFIREEIKGKKVAHYLSFPHNIQTNLDNMHSEAQASHEGEEVEEAEEGEEWGAGHEITHLPTEEREELPDIHTEEEEAEE
jgi:tetratricopeptide (TPR) repeat protein